MLALLAGCPKPAETVSTPAAVPEAAPETPERKLAVLIVLDQFPLELFEAGRPYYTGGLARLTGDQARQGVGVYPYATTQTCPGHVTLATGTEPSKSGIVANYLLAADGSQTYCADFALLKTEPLGDAVKEAGGKVVALSLKDRASLFLGGHSPDLMAYYDVKKDVIAGAEDLVARERIDEIFSEVWTPREDLGREDDRPNEGYYGLTPTFPHGPATELEGKARLATPMAGVLLTDMAIAAVDREGLGQDEAPDFLSVSYSNTDYVGHYFTASSLEALDNLLRVDAELERLFAHLDATVGEGQWTALLSSDHGGEDDPVDYIEGEPIAERVKARLAEAGIGGEIVFSWPEATIQGAAAGREAEAYAIAVEELAATEGVISAFTTDAIPDGESWSEAVRMSYDTERSAPIYGISAEGVVFDWYEQHGSDHGSPHDYDRRVPVLLYGAGVAPGELGDVDIRQVAPTLTSLVGARSPKDATLPAIGLE